MSKHKFLSANEAQKSFRFSLLRWKETESFQYLIDLKKSSDNKKNFFVLNLSNPVLIGFLILIDVFHHKLTL